MKTKVYMVMRDCGDGSVVGDLFYDEDVVDWMLERQEGFGEPCSETIEIESYGPITVKNCHTKESYYSELIKYGDEEDAEEFRKEFKV